MENEEFGSILDREVYETIQTGEVIEEYLKDRPYPGFLIFGKTNVDRPLHGESNGVCFLPWKGN